MLTDKSTWPELPQGYFYNPDNGDLMVEKRLKNGEPINKRVCNHIEAVGKIDWPFYEGGGKREGVLFQWDRNGELFQMGFPIDLSAGGSAVVDTQTRLMLKYNGLDLERGRLIDFAVFVQAVRYSLEDVQPLQGEAL